MFRAFAYIIIDDESIINDEQKNIILLVLSMFKLNKE